MNNSLKDTWQYLESLFCHLITCGSDPGVQVFQLDHLSCSVHHYFLPEIITKSHQLSVMTTRRNFSSPSLVTQLLFFARSVPMYLPCYIPPWCKTNGLWESERKSPVPGPHCIRITIQARAQVDNTAWCLHFGKETSRQAWKRQGKKSWRNKTIPSPTSPSVLVLCPWKSALMAM